MLGLTAAAAAAKSYGARVKYGALPVEYRQQTTTAKGICTEIYQFTALHQLFAQPLNVVVIVKTNSETGARAHAILFSSDLNQTYDQIIDYYTLRFQIEFNFRDAKQYWGLEDFMNVKELPVTNAVNLAFCMVNLAQVLRQRWRPKQPDFSVLDLKAHFRGLEIRDRNIEIAPAEAGANCFSTNRCQDRPIGRCQRHIMAKVLLEAVKKQVPNWLGRRPVRARSSSLTGLYHCRQSSTASRQRQPGNKKEGAITAPSPHVLVSLSTCLLVSPFPNSKSTSLPIYPPYFVPAIRGSNASRSPSPRKVKAMTTSATQTAGASSIINCELMAV